MLDQGENNIGLINFCVGALNRYSRFNVSAINLLLLKLKLMYSRFNINADLYSWR